MMPLVVPMIIATAKNTGEYVPAPPPVFETLSKYSDIDGETFFETAKRQMKEHSDKMALMQSITLIGTLFNFDNSKESKKVALVNFVLGLDIKGPSWFERVFKGM